MKVKGTYSKVIIVTDTSKVEVTPQDDGSVSIDTIGNDVSVYGSENKILTLILKD